MVTRSRTRLAYKAQQPASRGDIVDGVTQLSGIARRVRATFNTEEIERNDAERRSKRFMWRRSQCRVNVVVRAKSQCNNSARCPTLEAEQQNHVASTKPLAKIKA